MLLLRLINLAGWLLVLAYMAPAVLGILRGKPRDGDPARLIYAAFALLVVGFNLRFLALPESVVFHWGLLILSIVVAGFTLRAARAYGRGTHV
jgi:hypothetical protein